LIAHSARLRPSELLAVRIGEVGRWAVGDKALLDARHLTSLFDCSQCYLTHVECARLECAR
jgi:hypothetical protein